MKRIAFKNWLDKGYLLIWGVFFIYLLCQHHMVWMYMDDFGYASINYAVSVGTIGNNYNFMDIIRYLYLHYTEWGGRVLFYGIQILVYHFCGLAGMRFVQSVLIWLFFWLIFNIIRHITTNVNLYISSGMCCLLYGIFQTGLTKDGLYWFSASVGYVWPLPFLLLSSIIFFKMVQNDNFRKKFILLDGILWFITGFSQEQIAVAAVVICFCICVYSYTRNKKNIIACLILVLCALAGALFMLLAPGNMVRAMASESRNIFEQFTYNFSYLVIYLALEKCKIFVCCFSVCFSIVSWKLRKKIIERKVMSCLLLIYCLISGLVTTISLISTTGLYDLGISYFIEIYIIYLLIGILIVGIFLVYQKMYLQFIIMIGAVCSYAAMSFVPAIPYRILIPFIFLLLPVMASIIMLILEDNKNILILMPIWILLIGNICYLWKGYSINYSYQEHNWEQLDNYAINGGKQIELYELPNEEFTGPMSYIEENKWSEGLIKIYFEIPADCVFKYITL